MPDFPSFPNERALQALDRRGLKLNPSGNWYEVWQEQHQTAFTVAQSAGFDILGDIYAALRTAINDGITFEEFRDNLTPILQAKGWWGKDEDGKYLGTPWRLKTIFQTNLRVSAAQGEWQEIQELKEECPYLRYTALVDSRTRPLHKSWHGTILPVDHPWWKMHFPPNGWNCRCKALSLDEDELEFYGWKVSDKAPDDGFSEWVNPHTGDVLQVPNGIDPGWAYNPGAVDQAAHSAKLAMDKLAALPPQMGAEAITRLALSFPQVERELTEWITGITAQVKSGQFMPKGERRIVGALPDEAIKFAKDNGLRLKTAAIAVRDEDLFHALRTNKEHALPVEAWEALPTLLQSAKAIYWDNKKPGFIYLLEDENSKLVVLVNYVLKGSGTRAIVNLAHTGRKIKSTQEFEDYVHYSRIK